MASYIFGGDTGETPESIARKRALVARILGTGPTVAPRNNWDGLGNAFASIAGGFAARNMDQKADAAASAGKSSADDLRSQFTNMIMGNQFPAAPNPGNSSSMADMPAPDYASSRVAQAFGSGGDGSLPGSFLSALDRTEGAGDYDTLFGHAQRQGGRFAGTRISEMPISDVLAFADPQGAYGQHVKGKIGRVATPMGRGQIVGTTLRNAVRELGIDPSTPFNTGTQHQIMGHLARRRIAGASTMDGKIAGLRSEWEGFKNVPRSQMEQIVRDFESGPSPSAAASSQSNGLTPGALQQWAFANYAPATSGGASGAVNALASGQPIPPAPIQVASLDPSIGMASATPSMPQEYADTGLSQEAWARMNAPDGAVPAAVSPGPENALAASGKGDRVTMAQTSGIQMQPGPIPNPSPEQSAFLGRMTSPSPMTGGAPMPMQGMPQSAPSPAPAPAQPQPDLSRIPVTAGGNAGVMQLGQLPPMDVGLLMQVLGNPFMDDGTKAYAQAMLQQQMQANDPMRQLDMDYKRAQIGKMQREADSAGNEVFGTPIYGRDPQSGQMVLGAIGKDGTFKRLDTGGVDVTPGVTWQDFGTHRQAFDKSGNPVGVPVAKENFQEASDKAEGAQSGKSRAEAQAELSKVEDNAFSILGMIDSLDNDPYLDSMLGPVSSRLPNVSAEAARVQSKMDQIGGQAFLQAFQTLRGGGQISNVEGEKAQAAIARLSTAQSPKDYRDALNELRTIVQSGLDRARRSVSGGSPAGEAPGDGWQDMGGVKIRRKQ